MNKININKKDLTDMQEFLYKVEIIKKNNSNFYISLFDIQDAINDLIKQYQLKNPIFNLLHCIKNQNQVELIINMQHINTRYVYSVINTVFNSNYLLNKL